MPFLRVGDIGGRVMDSEDRCTWVLKKGLAACGDAEFLETVADLIRIDGSSELIDYVARRLNLISVAYRTMEDRLDDWS